MVNKITYGLQDVHIAPFTNVDTPAWGTPVAIPGAVKFTPSPQGQDTNIYADNVLYYAGQTNNGYKADLEIAHIPDSVLEDILGWRIDANGALVEVADGTPVEFALMFQVQGDAKNRRVVYYRCKASRAAREHGTKGEALDPKSDVLALTIIPITIGSEKVVKTVMELSASNTAAYNAFFDAVTVPATAVTKVALAAAITLANSLVEATYTVGSWTPFAAAKTSATTVNADAGAVQAAVDSAHAALEAAMLALVPV